MRRHFIALIISVVGWLHMITSSAQQNLFNVPSSDITLEGKPFFQQQFNISHGLIQLNSTFCYGLPHHAEVGMNILSVDLNSDFTKPVFITNGNDLESPTYPFVTVNFQKAFILNKLFKLAAGTQLGYSSGLHFGTYTYGNLVTALTYTHSKIISGVYYGSNSMLGPEERNPIIPAMNPVGFQIGLEQQLIEEKLSFIAENITGKHGLGETSLGGAYFLTNHWVLSLGFQFANRDSKTANALVMEFTYVPSSEAHHKIYKHGHRHQHKA